MFPFNLLFLQKGTSTDGFFPSKSWLQKSSNGRSVAPPSSHPYVLNPSPRLAGEDVNGGRDTRLVFGWLLF